MPKMLNDGAVEYEDGTPATEAQVTWSKKLNVCQCFPTESIYEVFPRCADGKRCCHILVMGC